jgi:hypothetical protein
MYFQLDNVDGDDCQREIDSYAAVICEFASGPSHGFEQSFVPIGNGEAGTDPKVH